MLSLLRSLIPWRGRAAGDVSYTVFDWARGPHCPSARPYRQKGGQLRHKCKHPGRVEA